MIEKVRHGEEVISLLRDMSQDGWNVIAILRRPGSRLIIPGRNIVTSAGDKYYAQKAVGETPTINFNAGGLRMGSSITAPAKTNTDVITFIAGTGIAEAATYPKTNDLDTNNTGAGVTVVSWSFVYTTAQGNGSGIAEGAVVDNITTPTAALCRFLFASAFSKTSANTLTVFVNHTFLGV